MLARVPARLLQGLTDLACTVCRDERVSDGTPHWCHESNGLPVWCYKSCADSHATQAHPERLTFPVAGSSCLVSVSVGDITKWRGMKCSSYATPCHCLALPMRIQVYLPVHTHADVSSNRRRHRQRGQRALPWRRRRRWCDPSCGWTGAAAGVPTVAGTAQGCTLSHRQSSFDSGVSVAGHVRHPHGRAKPLGA